MHHRVSKPTLGIMMETRKSSSLKIDFFVMFQHYLLIGSDKFSLTKTILIIISSGNVILNEQRQNIMSEIISSVRFSIYFLVLFMFPEKSS